MQFSFAVICLTAADFFLKCPEIINYFDIMNIFKKLLRKTKQDFIPVQKVGKLEYIATSPKELLDFVLMLKAAATLKPAYGSVDNIRLKFIGLDAERCDPAFVYRSGNKAFIVFVGDTQVYKISLSSTPYCKCRRSDYIRIRHSGESSFVIDVYCRNQHRSVMPVKNYKTCIGFGRPHFIKEADAV